MKYIKYIIGLFLVLAIIWGIYNHYSITALENKNNALTKSNDVLIASMKDQKVQFQTQLDSLELRAKQLEATLTQLNTNINVLARHNIDLQNKLASLKIPAEKEGRIAKYKELGYEGESISAGAATPHEGVLFDWASSDKLLQTAMENPIIKEQNSTLKDEVALLEKKASTQDQIIKNTEQEVRLALTRAEFAEGQIVSKDRIIADQGKVNEDLVKKAKQNKWWFLGGFVAGIAITIAAVVGLGL
jgi:hypothetical protein